MRSLLPIFALVVLAATPAGASPFKAPPTFAQVDTDRDGFISPQEYLASLVARQRGTKGADKQFKKLDRNHDGKLDPREFAGKGRPPKHRPHV